MQAPDGSAVWLRLSTRQLHQPHRALDPAAVIAGAHWVVPPGAGAPHRAGLPGPGRAGGRGRLRGAARGVPGAGLLAITSPDRLHAGWLAAARAAPGGRPPVAHRAAAGAAGARRGAGHDPGRPPGGACLARRRARPARGPARARPVRPERRSAGPLPGIRPGRGCDPRCLRPGASWLSEPRRCLVDSRGAFASSPARPLSRTPSRSLPPPRPTASAARAAAAGASAARPRRC